MLPFHTKRIWIVSILALSALLGLLFIQFSWLQGMLQLQEERFNRETNEVLQIVNSEFDAYVGQYVDLKQVFKPTSDQYKERFSWAVRRLIDSVLVSNNLETDFEFGLQSCKSEDVKIFSDASQANLILQGSNVKLGGSCTVVPLAGNNTNHLHLYTIYPRKSIFLLRQLSGAIGSAILFVLIIGGAFIYTLLSFLRQRKLSEMKSDFVNNLTHEFKTPIASIKLAARTLKRLPDVSTSDKAQSYLSLIDQEGKRLENHVDKVLQVASIDSGNFMLDKQAVHIPSLIQDVLNSLQLQFEEREVSIFIHTDEEDMVLQADALHLFNVFYNLLDNAVKYGGQAVQIDIYIKALKDVLKVEIKDNGPGIQPEIQERIFEPFYRPHTGNLHKVKGFGLGLYYVRRLVEAHQGRVELASHPEEGSTFLLTFPLS